MGRQLLYTPVGYRDLYHVKWYRRFPRSDQVSTGHAPGLYHFSNLEWYRHNPRSDGVSIPPVPDVPEISDLTCTCLCVACNRPTTSRPGPILLGDAARTARSASGRPSPRRGFQIRGTSGTSARSRRLTWANGRATGIFEVVQAGRTVAIRSTHSPWSARGTRGVPEEVVQLPQVRRARTENKTPRTRRKVSSGAKQPAVAGPGGNRDPGGPR